MTTATENLTNASSNDLSNRRYKCGEFENNLSKYPTQAHMIQGRDRVFMQNICLQIECEKNNRKK